MFKSIFISSEDDVNIEERSYSMSGGLENDALRLAAESHFSFTTTDACECSIYALHPIHALIPNHYTYQPDFNKGKRSSKY